MGEIEEKVTAYGTQPKKDKNEELKMLYLWVQGLAMSK